MEKNRIKNIKSTLAFPFLGLGLYFLITSSVGYSSGGIRVTPNIAPENQGLIREKETQLGQAPRYPDPSDAPPLIRKEIPNSFKTNPCPPTLKRPELSKTKNPLREGCEFSKELIPQNPPSSRSLAGEAQKKTSN